MCKSGVDDLMLGMGESFVQWVIEDRLPGGRPALDAVGVELRDDVALFEADAYGKSSGRRRVASEPEALVAFLLGLGVTIVCVDLEAGPLC